ncbi:hypothetical protein [Rhodopirellula bahusiensis]
MNHTVIRFDKGKREIIGWLFLPPIAAMLIRVVCAISRYFIQ